MKNTKEAEKKIKDRIHGEYILLTPYVNSTTKIKIKHLACGTISWKLPNLIGKTQCMTCYRASRIMSTESFNKKMHQFLDDSFVLMSPYKGNNTKVKILHKTCNTTFFTLPRSITSAGVKCPHCSKVKIRQIPLVELEHRVNNFIGKEYTLIKRVDKYHIKVKHIPCGQYIIIPIPTHIRKTPLCPKCYPNEKTILLKNNTAKYSRENSAQLIKKYISTLPNTVSIISKIPKRMNEHIMLNCLKDGTQWNTTLENIKQGNGCPTCGRKKSDINRKKYTKETLAPYILKETNGEFELIGDFKTATKGFTLLHKRCGKTFVINIAHFKAGRRCPYCKESKGEAKCRLYLEKHNIKYIPQYKLCKNPKTDYWLYSDFLLIDNFDKKLGVIEYDGEQHWRARGVFTNRGGAKATQYRDKIKDDYCAKHNIPVLRIPYYNYDKVDVIIEKFINKIKENTN